MRTRLQAAKFFRTVIVVGVFGMVTATGCGGNAKPDAGKKAALKAVLASTENPFRHTSDSIPAMYLERADFLDSNNIKYKDKLIFQLTMQEDSNEFLLAIQPAGKSGKVPGTARAKYPKAFTNKLSAAGVMDTAHAFAEHHTKENDFQRLWDEVKKYKLVNYLLFEPMIDSNQHFCYKIIGVEKLSSDLSAAHGFATKTYYSHPSSHVWK